MKIGRLNIDDNSPCVVIAELGINHGGSVDTAKKMIDAAVDAGCDIVKFQKRCVEVCYTPDELARPRESPFGITNGDLKRGLEFGFDEYTELDRYCRFKDIIWGASPWDVKSVNFLERFDVPFYKVASACVTDLELLRAIKKTAKPVIVSTGMSSQAEVDKAVHTLRGFGGQTIRPLLSWPSGTDVALLVTTATYPSQLDELRLQRINVMQPYYPGLAIGWSHHAVSPWPALCAAVMGAKIIECHLTLDRSMWGSDQSSSLEPAAFKKLVQEIRDFETARGDGTIGMIESERPILEKLRRFP